PDLFWRIERNVQLTDKDFERAIDFYQKIDEHKAVEDSAAALEFLRRSTACSGHVGAVGFCMGGNLAYLLSTRFKPDCAVGYYGVSVEKSLNEAKNLSSPLMLHIAGLDKFCPPEAQAQIHAALDANPLVTLHDYPGMDHAGVIVKRDERIRIERCMNLRLGFRWAKLVESGDVQHQRTTQVLRLVETLLDADAVVTNRTIRFEAR